MWIVLACALDCHPLRLTIFVNLPKRPADGLALCCRPPGERESWLRKRPPTLILAQNFYGTGRCMLKRFIQTGLSMIGRS